MGGKTQKKIFIRYILLVPIYKIFLLESFRKIALEIHNKLRRIHGANDLIESSDLNKKAQRHALNAAKSGVLEPTEEGDEGENLAVKCSTKEMPGDEAILHW